ncbi:hypothetical protein [uncultured Dialister sp.]|jgi:hypothetical protein|uniref:hypothetical protein n=1 Tax=uncultured Dialister sp. TaxID=278064 RepID=UPI0025E724C9|nr:hypothetical protein [uncultured Dialister sp.]
MHGAWQSHWQEPGILKMQDEVLSAFNHSTAGGERTKREPRKMENHLSWLPFIGVIAGEWLYHEAWRLLHPVISTGDAAAGPQSFFRNTVTVIYLGDFSTLSHNLLLQIQPSRRVPPEGKRVTGFSVAFSSLRIQFPCHRSK